MAATNDPNPSLRDEMVAALAFVTPQIRGLQDLVDIPASAELTAVLQERLAAERRRASLIAGVISALDAVVAARDALDEDGYPDTTPLPIPTPVFDQLTAEIADLEAAAAVFAEQPVASQISVNLGEPQSKVEG